ncbi:type II toxin-antitoxin system Phd/YefM family antitoxin [Agaribacterium haliotis]|uniref:type II toxin-antitoxin system Phd/YefM family antitoxin n=1 Tax=Agaribacterium haliotis TaxID=2013869 RepID=UPI000BB5759D|nr:type II toxin-antitoxin system Phd/YefM family antitoxin [Agaribacterium haliotis]
METYRASDAKREFGELLLKSQSGPVSVTRNGKPVAVVLSETEYQSLKLNALRAALTEGEQSGFEQGLSADGVKAIARQRLQK